MDNTQVNEEDINVEGIMRSIRDKIRRDHARPADRPEEKPGSSMPLIRSRDVDRELSFLLGNAEILNNEYSITSHRKMVGPVIIGGRRLVHGEVRRYVDPITWKQNKFNANVARALNEVVNEADHLLTSLRADVDGIGRRMSDIEVLRSDLAEAGSLVGKLQVEVEDIGRRLGGMETLRADVDSIQRRINIMGRRLDGVETLRADVDSLGMRMDGLEEVRGLVDGLRADLDRMNGRFDDVEVARRDVNTGLRQHAESIRTELRSEIARNNDQAYERQAILFARLNAVSDNFAKAGSHADKPMESSANLVAPVMSSFYLSFENTFRGSEREIKDRQGYYLQYFSTDGNVLDIGCGRGEFLELLKGRGINATGIEIDDYMYNYAASKGLDVKNMDIFEYLASVDDDSLGGVFMAQVIEHIEPTLMPALLQIVFNKLKPGRHMVIETVNLLNVGAFMNFYVDPTHIRPVHPLYLEYLLKVSGYRDIEIVYRTYEAVPEGLDTNRIKEIAPDYAIICKR